MNAGALYRFAWRHLPKVNQRVVVGGAHLAADVVWALNPPSVKQMRKNYQRLSLEAVSERQVRQGVRSYFRNFAQQFTLPGWSKAEIDASASCAKAGDLSKMMEDGPVVFALTHSGNWDLIGAWFSQNFGKILTVAEKLEPADLFDQFVEFRESLGLEIIGVAPGERVFRKLVARAQGRSILVPLLADRDISGSGIEVDLGGSRALVAAGPAALALELNRPLVAGHISYHLVDAKWTIVLHVTDPISPPEPAEGETAVEALTRAWVREITPVMQRHLVDWHMMQKLFVDDLDPVRLERARMKALSLKEPDLGKTPQEQ